MMEKIVQHLLKEEGFRSKAYPDPGSKDGHPWTIGIGSTFYEDGSQVKPGDTITRERALRLAETVALNKIVEVKQIFRGIPFNENQFIALVSICYNIGSGLKDKSKKFGLVNTGLAKLINERAPMSEIVERWKKTYIHNDGKKMQNLIDRRAREAALYSKNI